MVEFAAGKKRMRAPVPQPAPSSSQLSMLLFMPGQPEWMLRTESMTLPQVSNCTRTGLAGATYLYQASREVGWQMEPPSEVKEVVLPVKVPLVTAVALAQASACAWAAEVRAETARAERGGAGGSVHAGPIAARAARRKMAIR